jgi:hypothetical protein
MVGGAIINGNRTRGTIGSLTNRTDQGWFLSGLAPKTGISVTWRATRELKANNKIVIPKKPKAGLHYMMGNNPSGRYMLSKNPQCSGGVGRKSSPHCKLIF